jgi:hypothetical protein
VLEKWTSLPLSRVWQGRRVPPVTAVISDPRKKHEKNVPSSSSTSTRDMFLYADKSPPICLWSWVMKGFWRFVMEVNLIFSPRRLLTLSAVFPRLVVCPGCSAFSLRDYLRFLVYTSFNISYRGGLYLHRTKYTRSFLHLICLIYYPALVFLIVTRPQDIPRKGTLVNWGGSQRSKKKPLAVTAEFHTFTCTTHSFLIIKQILSLRIGLEINKQVHKKELFQVT